MSRFEITDLGLGVKAIKLIARADARGSLTRLFCSQELAAMGWLKPIAQVNWVETKNCGTLRGMHYQAAPFAENKILFCMAGEIHDVAVDVRQGSKSLLHHVAVNLSGPRVKGYSSPLALPMDINA